MSECRTRFGGARVARLATADATGCPHLVPVTFALLDGVDRVVWAVDHKPKRTTALRRLANIAARPQVSLLADDYSEDWSALWWVRADGRAHVLSPPADGEPADVGAAVLRTAAIDALVARYAPYRERPPAGAVVVIDVERWSGWAAAG